MYINGFESRALQTLRTGANKSAIFDVAMNDKTRPQVAVTHIDTACILLEINGFRILTDPTLDNAGGWYHHGFGAVSRKTQAPAVDPVDLTNIDLILLSHHQHKDNFDRKGRELALRVGRIISTKAAARALPGAIGLDEWECHPVDTDKCPGLRITATPARHHPWWLPGFFAGKVVGFVIEYEGQDNGVLYISGDTVYFHGIDEVADRYTIDVALLHAGSAQFRYLSGLGRYTMHGKDLIRAVHALRPKLVAPIHHKGWSHFKETESRLKVVLANEDWAGCRLVFLQSGVKTAL